jgi:hypothetical protein
LGGPNAGKLLIRNEWQGVDVEDLVRAQLAYFADLVGSRIVVDGAPVAPEARERQLLRGCLDTRQRLSLRVQHSLLEFRRPNLVGGAALRPPVLRPSAMAVYSDFYRLDLDQRRVYCHRSAKRRCRSVISRKTKFLATTTPRRRPAAAADMRGLFDEFGAFRRPQRCVG